MIETRPKPDKQRVLSDYARRTGWSKVDGLSPSPKHLKELKQGRETDGKDYHYWNEYDPVAYGEKIKDG